ncbi:hypothetical protein [Sulfitobacter sabulilitoris]|uniref:Arginine transporter n=1 Tax=Sulfitobacter sabulilitoris TaxID=2562655 RepID=A0A5S3PC39_9RHOB|nr:hypothetical protein [Sulfitobacter sabulilitoris]TMM51243.1 hypothetical protein FDT80_15410 [Sulfitobacter sabulilitoris]
MTRLILALGACGVLAACGGGTRYSSYNAQGTVVPVLFATGPIATACMADNRKAASRARCGCVQAVADRALSGPDQRRGARYFEDPGKLQEVRQSSNAANERFWLAWKAFGNQAANLCRAT